MFTKNKILFYLFVLNIFAKIILAQDARYYIQTPRGSDVPDTYQTIEMPTSDRAGWDNYFATNYPNATQIKLPGETYSSTRTFNCHGYAWRYIDFSQRLWIGYSQAGSEEVFWNDGSYDAVSEAVCTKISYTGDHSAIPSGTANYYYSKWRFYPLMYHQKDYTPGYGTANQFFRRSVDVPQDQSSINLAVSAAVSGQTVNVSSGSYTLTGNISISTGINLNLISTSQINLNGYSITSTGGTITVQTGTTIYGALLKTGSTINAIYPSIESALSAASSGQTVQVLSSMNVSNNVTVPSVVTLSINSGVTLTFSPGKRLNISGSGTLIANNVTFQGNGTAGYWYAIYFYANSNGSIQSSTIKDAQCGIYANQVNSLSVSNSIITNNSLYGFSLINSTATISNCTIQNNGTGINSSSSRPAITGCTIQNNTNYGITASNITPYQPHLFWYDNNFSGNGYAILLNNASPYIHTSVISDNYHGITITSGSPNFADPSNQWRGYNAITCNYAIPNFRAQNYSSVYMGYGYDGGYNSLFGSELPDMEAYSNSTIYACNNYWGSPYPAINVDGTSTILAWYPLGSDPNPGSCSFNKSSSTKKSSALDDENDISKVYLEAISNMFGNNISIAKELLKSIIEGEFDSKYTPLALLTYYDLNAKEKDLSGSEYTSDEILRSVYNRDKEDSLRPFAVRLLAREEALLGNFDEMIFYNTEIIENYPNSSNEISALYDLVNYYAEEEDSVTSSKYLKRMNEIYPDDDLTLFANINLGLNSEYLGKNNVTDKEQIPKVYSLGDNFPNPFNPTTKISFSIPKNERVVLIVYDILGKVMEVLVNEEKAAGNYNMTFNASNLASGVYIYKIQAGDFVNSKKMMLLK
jgi:tetratricopeptide (TPR) repeat protein